MKALVFERQLVRFAASRVASNLRGSGRGVSVGPLELLDVEQPALLAEGFVRVVPRLSGICGSDLATLDGRSSRYFEHIVSFPFVPGHEVVGDVLGGEHDGRRVVLEPILACRARQIDPPCPACARGESGRCERIAFGALSPGLQTGYCADTGGGWSAGLVAHESQLHVLDDAVSDEAAVMIEPTACAVHAALSAAGAAGKRVMVLGSGTLGLLTIAALGTYVLPALIVAVAKYPEQRRLATELGADLVVAPGEATRAVRRLTGSLALGSEGDLGRLTGGVDVVFDCVGSESSLATSLSVVRAGGEIVLVGMPSSVRIDLAPLWQREVNLRGAYAYGTEETPAGPRRTFELARELVAERDLGRLVSARYPLERYEEAIAHAGSAGSRGAVKIVFDMRKGQSREVIQGTARKAAT